MDSGLPFYSEPLALSFGGGVQTTALLVMAVRGEVERPDLVAFADTGCEWPETYDYISRYIKPLVEKAEIEFVTVKHPSKTLLEYYWHYRAIPMPQSRACTHNFKISPISKLYGQRGIQKEWVGFSAEEGGRASRKKPIRKGVKADFPLITLGLTRADCAAEIARFGLPEPLKSSCVCCPFQHPSRIALLSQRHPDLFEQVGKLEDRSLSRLGKVPYYIAGDRPWRTWARAEQLGFGGDWAYGCADGYCFR